MTMQASVGSGGSYRFGLFEVDGRTGELRKQGRSVKLRGRPFDILLLLLDRGGDVIRREELRQQLWPADTFVDFDHGLNSAMNRLREALGDSAESPRFVETLPKRGYRFIAPIEVLDRDTARLPPSAIANPEAREAVPVVNASSSDSARTLQPEALPVLPPEPLVEQPTASVFRVSQPSRVVLMAATAALAVALVVALLFLRAGQNRPPHSSKMTLAVLPFDNLSADADQDFFSDGFTEEMIAELGKLDPDRLGVIARTTTRLYKNARKNIGQIHQELGVDYVLEGSIRRAGNRMRITAQLVQTSDMTHLWAESYDRDVSDVLAIQSEVAMKIARSLTLALRRPDAGSARGTRSASAYDLYLRGRSFRDQATEESTRKAIEYFQRAIASDPEYARAHAGIADAYWLLGAPGWEVEQPMAVLQKAQSSAERALAIDPQLAEARAVLAMVRLSYRWDRPGSEREIQEAIRLNPSSAISHQYYSTVLTTMGRFDEAIAEARRALELDPLSAPASTTLAVRYLYAGRLAEAMTQFSKIDRRESRVRRRALGTGAGAPGKRRQRACAGRAPARVRAVRQQRVHAGAPGVWPFRCRQPGARRQHPARARQRIAGALSVAVSPGIDRGGVGRSGGNDARARARARRPFGVDGVPAGPARVRARASGAGVPAPARTSHADAVTQARARGYLSIVIIGALNDASPSIASAHAQ